MKVIYSEEDKAVFGDVFAYIFISLVYVNQAIWAQTMVQRIFILFVQMFRKFCIKEH